MMQDLNQLFHEGVYSRGGRYVNHQKDNLSIVQKSTIAAGEELIGHLRNENDKYPRAHIDFINNTSFNACAFKYRDVYFIGINIELIIILLRLFNYIFSHPKIIPQIGDPSKEIETDIIRNVTVSDYNYLQLFSNYDTEVYLPIDNDRQKSAYKFYFKAIEFLIMHEYGHILMGHVDFMEHRNRSSFIFEATSSENGGLLNQTLEMDADCYATKVSFHRIVSIYEHDLLSNDSLQFEEYLFNWYFSIYFIFRLFAAKQYEVDNLDKYSHPVPGIRQWLVLITLYSLLEKEEYAEYNDYKHKLPQIFEGAAKECEHALKLISEETFNKAPISVLTTDRGYYQIYKIMNNWKHVRPLLIPFSMNNLAPITEWKESAFLKSPWNKQ